MIILGLVYIFVLWYVAQSPYRCDRVDHLPYLKLMCEKDKSKSELKIPEPSWKPGDEPMGYDLEGAMVTPYPSGAPEKWYGPPPPYPEANECVY